MGTWEFYKDDPTEGIDEVLQYAVEHGVRHFDTALVYGNGEAERALGRLVRRSTGSLPGEELFISTKLPGIRKPDADSRLDEVYPRDWMERCFESSLNALGEIDTLLLHNWAWQFEQDDACSYVFELMESWKKQGLCRSIGISLPNRFGGTPCGELVRRCDSFMVPVDASALLLSPGSFSVGEGSALSPLWGREAAVSLVDADKITMVRSLFQNRQNVPKSNAEKAEAVRRLPDVDRIVIGTTSRDHLQEWIKIMEVQHVQASE